MLPSSSAAGARPGPVRHSAAFWRRPLSLRARLRLFVITVVVVVVGATAMLEVWAFERSVERNLEQLARQTADAVADELRNSPANLESPGLRDVLHEFIEANGALRSISLLNVSADGPHLVASTLSEERQDNLVLAEQAIASHGPLERVDSHALVHALPLSGSFDTTAVVVTVSLAGVEQVQARGGQIALGFALPAIILVTVLVELISRRLVHRPVAAIQRTMQQAGSGVMGARSPVIRDDELGAVASGLNAMLARIEDFNDTLQERVREATAELELRNEQLRATYDQAIELREGLARAERLAALGNMAAAVAHQAGTPLNLVSGYVQMLRDDAHVDARTRRRLEIIDTEIRQVTTVLRSMLDAARRPIRPEPTSMPALVRRVMRVAGPRLSASHIREQVDVHDGLPSLPLDALQFELALMALVSNAIDAMPDGGTLTIAASRGDEHLRLTVSDTGPGIPSNLREQAFEPWVTTKPSGKGTGLGLSVARDVVRAHGGHISIDRSEGGGARLVIDLPIPAPAPVVT